MRVAVYTITCGRLGVTKKSFKALRNMAGVEFDHYVADNGSDEEMRSYLQGAKDKGHIHTLQLHDENYGQNIATNYLLDEMDKEEPYDWVLRWDNDAMPRAPRFLAKLISLAEKAPYPAIWVPFVTGQWPCPRHNGKGIFHKYRVELVSIAGGMCRLSPWSFFSDGFRFNRFAALGLGEAEEVSGQCGNIGYPIFRVPRIKVHHLGFDAKETDQSYLEFERKGIRSYVSYGF